MWEKRFSSKEFIERFSHRIRNILYQKLPGLNETQKEDIEQEVKLKIWKMLCKGRKIENLKSYLWRVVYTTALDMIEDKTQKGGSGFERVDNDEQYIEIPGDNPPLDEWLEKRRMNALLMQEINSLGYDHRIVIKLYLTGRNIREISEFLGWSNSKVNHLFYRGLNKLKAKNNEQTSGKESNQLPGS